MWFHTWNDIYLGKALIKTPSKTTSIFFISYFAYFSAKQRANNIFIAIKEYWN